jgi:hypothetical protein
VVFLNHARIGKACNKKREILPGVSFSKDLVRSLSQSRVWGEDVGKKFGLAGGIKMRIRMRMKMKMKIKMENFDDNKSFNISAR